MVYKDYPCGNNVRWEGLSYPWIHVTWLGDDVILILMFVVDALGNSQERSPVTGKQTCVSKKKVL